MRASRSVGIESLLNALEPGYCRGDRLPRSPIGQQSDALVDQGPQLVVQRVVALVVEVGLVSSLQRGLDHRPRVGQAERPHHRVGLFCERATHTYDADQFGITDQALAQHFGSYRDRFAPLLA